MGELMLPVADWATLENFAFGASVLHLGYTGGTDTASLARTATMVVCAMPADPEPDSDATTASTQWADTVRAAGAHRRVVALPGTGLLTLRSQQRGWFDLAVVNLPALHRWRTEDIIPAVTHAARNTAVIGAADGEARAAVLGAAHGHTLRHTACGSLTILTWIGGEQDGGPDHL